MTTETIGINAQNVIAGIRIQISEKTAYMRLLQNEEAKARVQKEIEQLMTDLEIMQGFTSLKPSDAEEISESSELNEI